MFSVRLLRSFSNGNGFRNGLLYNFRDRNVGFGCHVGRMNIFKFLLLPYRFINHESFKHLTYTSLSS